jgi:uncharacterized protein YndB with AHSA1/START domain
MSTTPFVIERTYPVPAQKVWEAITNKDKMKQWYFDLKEFRPEVGFTFEFDGGKEGRIYHHICKITEVVPGQKLTHTWKYQGYPGVSYVTFELFEEGDNTRLKLTHAGIETFPANEPDFAAHNFAEGWNYIIGTSLQKYLGQVV